MAMGETQDSSGSLPDVHDGDVAAEAMLGSGASDAYAVLGSAERAALLSDHRLRTKILKIARRRGVPDRYLEDVLHDTLKSALTAALPAAEDEARRYIHRIAVNAARKLLNEVRPDLEEPYDENDEDDEGENKLMPAFAQPVRFEDREVVRKVVDAGYERFPRTFPWFLRSRVLDETADEIAKDDAVQASHVRHEISLVQRFVRHVGERMGAIAVIGLFFLVGALAYWIRRPLAGPAPSPTEAEHVLPAPEPSATPAPTNSAATEPTPAERGASYRAAARQSFDQGHYVQCLRDLAAADAIDPDGAAASSELRSKANKELDAHSTKSGKPLPR